ncbi:MAG TPA: ribonuclease R [Vicinamibacteria bacterium]|nr:ribonuclease R [Vicinamibacteria bacterium]
MRSPRDPRPARPETGVPGPEASALKDRILEVLTADGKPVSVRELVRRLDLRGEARRTLKGQLRQLIADGEVVQIRGPRIGLPSRMNLVVGRLTCNPAGYGFVIPEREASPPPRPYRRRSGAGPDKGGGGATGGARRSEPTAKRGEARKDLYVSALNMKEALHGDRVVARVERVTAKGAEGRIIRVLERAQQRLVGRYEEDGRAGGRVVPFDRRILHELFVPPGDNGGAKAGEMVSAEITRPPTATRNPSGRVLAVLGRLQDPGVDLRVVMAKYGLPDAFPEEVEADAARVPSQVGPADVAGRTDFRPWATVTVDPETARDHDDAISLDRLPHGHWRLAVHIADVAHYVREGGLIDQEAYLRGTSVYFPDRVVPMLPHPLSSNICSLVEGADRLTQSVVMEIDGKGRVRKAEFHDGVIRSAARMTYQQVQKIVDGDAELRARFAPLVPLLEGMDALAKLMRARRYERGSLDFDLPEPKLVLNAAGEMTGIVASERLDSMRVIEEFMLAANEAVADRLAEAGVGALFRIHEEPDPQRVEEFCELVASLGYRLPGNLEGVRPEDFQLILRQIEGKPEEKLVSYLLLRTMKLARYHEQNLGHFGLATESYAHFTSPIRRYPDLVVHRALRALRQGLDPAREAQLREALPEMGRHLSEMERRATDAERELTEWKKVRFMADKLGEVFSGYITGVQAFGLFVELEEIYVQGLVHVSSMIDDYYLFNEKAHTLKGENTRKVYRLGDKVEVQLVRVDLERRQLDFGLPEAMGGQPRPRGERSPEVRGHRPGAARGARGRGRPRR